VLATKIVETRERSFFEGRDNPSHPRANDQRLSARRSRATIRVRGADEITRRRAQFVERSASFQRRENVVISVTQCAESSGLAPNEMILGVTPSSRHHSLFASYLLNGERSPAAIRDMIICDLRSFLELGAKQRAADLLIVLRLLLSDYPQARRTVGVAGHLLTREKFVNSSSSYATRAKRAARDYTCPSTRKRTG
jgi:hypothetical protein